MSLTLITTREGEISFNIGVTSVTLSPPIHIDWGDSSEEDIEFSTYSLILNFNGVDGATTWIEEAHGFLPSAQSGTCELDTDYYYEGISSLGLFSHEAYVEYDIVNGITNDFNYKCYFRFDGLSGTDGIYPLEMRDSGYNAYIDVCVYLNGSDTNLRVYSKDYSGTEIGTYDSSILLSTNTWHKLNVDCSGRSLIVSINDTVIVTQTASIDDPFYGANYISVWNFTDSNNFWVDKISLNNPAAGSPFTKRITHNYSGSGSKNIEITGDLSIISYLDANTSSLTSIDISDCLNLLYLDCHANSLPSSILEDMLLKLIEFNSEGGSLDMSGNSDPTQLEYIRQSILSSYSNNWYISSPITLKHRYWVPESGTKYWSDTANWSATAYPLVGGASIPDELTVAHLGSFYESDVVINVDIDINCAGIESPYSAYFINSVVINCINRTVNCLVEGITLGSLTIDITNSVINTSKWETSIVWYGVFGTTVIGTGSLINLKIDLSNYGANDIPEIWTLFGVSMLGVPPIYNDLNIELGSSSSPSPIFKEAIVYFLYQTDLAFNNITVSGNENTKLSFFAGNQRPSVYPNLAISCNNWGIVGNIDDNFYVDLINLEALL